MPSFKEMVENFSFPSGEIGRGELPSTDKGSELVGICANARAAEMALLALKTLERQGEKMPGNEANMLKITLAMNYANGGITQGQFGAQKLVDDYLKKADTALDAVYGKSQKLDR